MQKYNIKTFPNYVNEEQRDHPSFSHFAKKDLGAVFIYLFLVNLKEIKNI